MSDKISIIVPIYNAEDYLERCLSSLQQQTYRNIEVIMVDDGSIDASTKICLEYRNADDRFKYIRQANSGVSAARNRGIREADGDYIGFCDSDDWVEGDMYEVLLALVLQYAADVAIVSFIFDDGNAKPNDMSAIKAREFSGHEALLEMHRGRLFAGQMCNKLIRKELLNGIWFDERINIFEDMLVMRDVFAKSSKVVFLGTQKYHYYVNPLSSINAHYRDSCWTVRLATKLIMEKTRKSYPENIAYARLTAIIGDLWLLDKLVHSRKLSKSIYQLIKKDFVINYDRDVRSLMDRKQRIKSYFFVKSRRIFILFHKLLCLYHIVYLESGRRK